MIILYILIKFEYYVVREEVSILDVKSPEMILFTKIMSLSIFASVSIIELVTLKGILNFIVRSSDVGIMRFGTKKVTIIAIGIPCVYPAALWLCYVGSLEQKLS